MMYFHVWFVTKYRKIRLEGKTEQLVKDIFAECISRHNYKERTAFWARRYGSKEIDKGKVEYVRKYIRRQKHKENTTGGSL